MQMDKNFSRKLRSDMDHNEEEAKELPTIYHESAIRITGNALKNVLEEFGNIDRVSILQQLLDNCDPFCIDNPVSQGLKNNFVDYHRNWELFEKELNEANGEFKTRQGCIEE